MMHELVRRETGHAHKHTARTTPHNTRHDIHTRSYNYEFDKYWYSPGPRLRCPVHKSAVRCSVLFEFSFLLSVALAPHIEDKTMPVVLAGAVRGSVLFEFSFLVSVAVAPV